MKPHFVLVVTTCQRGRAALGPTHAKHALASRADESDQVGAIAAAGGRLRVGSDVGAAFGYVWEQLRCDRRAAFGAANEGDVRCAPYFFRFLFKL